MGIPVMIQLHIMFTTFLMVIMFTGSLCYEDVSSKAYLDLSASEKSRIIFQNCLENTSPADWFSTFKMLGLFWESMCPTLRAQGDELPKDRSKYIHTVGSTGRVEWQDLGGHNYTGLFEGADFGIVRLSLAKEPNEDELNTTPGMGLKFLRDGMDSSNLVAMFGLDGQDSWNFFENDFSNHIGEGSAANLPIKLKFSRYAMHVQQVGLSDWSTHKQDGTQVENPVFPYSLRFHPTGKITFPTTYTKPLSEHFATIENGTTLYEIFALDKPREMNGIEEHIGNLVTTSRLVSSWWGDRRLFFRHQDMAEDLSINPEWKEFTPHAGNEHESPC